MLSGYKTYIVSQQLEKFPNVWKTLKKTFYTASDERNDLGVFDWEFQ